jgi:hypothetical protein
MDERESQISFWLTYSVKFHYDIKDGHRDIREDPDKRRLRL